MILLQVEQNVSSYSGWKTAFDNDPINRKKSGVTSYNVYQSAEDSLHLNNSQPLTTAALVFHF